MNKENKSGYLNRITFIYFIILAVALFTLVLAAGVSRKHIPSKSDYQKFDDGWTDEAGESVTLSKLGHFDSIVKTIPELDTDRLLSLRVRSMNVQVFIDSEEVYSTDSYAENLFGKTPGYYYVRILLKTSDVGKKIRIKQTFTYNDDSAKITDMYIGDGTDIITDSMRSTMVGFIISVLMTFLGMLLVVIYVSLFRRKLVPNEMLYLGLFSISVGLYLMTNSGFLNLVIFRENLIHMIEEIWIMLIVVPLICFLDCKYPGKNNKPVVISLTSYCFAVFVFCYTAHWLNWKDYHELMTLNHIGFVFTIVYFTYCIARAIKSGSSVGRKWYLIGPVFIFAGVILDMINWKFRYKVNSSVFTRAGVLLFLILEGIQIVEKMLIQYQQGIKNQIVSRLAYHDGLTDMLNRTSFMEEQERMEKDNDFGIVAMFDVNNLKKVNDNLGHTKGDELIVSAANAIDKSFGNIGKCFRTGGDEFVLMTDHRCSEARFLECKARFDSAIEEAAKGKDYPISVACGYALWDEDKYSNFNEFLNEADSRMYENKKQMKAVRPFSA